MDRRCALSLLGLGLLAGCGGGGGAGAVASPAGAVVSPGGGTTAPAAPDAAQPGQPQPGRLRSLSPNIACWGDSITDLYAGTLQQFFPGREVYNGGVVGQTSMQIAARQAGDTGRSTWIQVLWYGHNNWIKDPVKADIAASVAALAPGNEAFIVLSMLNWATTGAKGTQEYEETIRVNHELATMYPDHYLDMRAHLVSLYDPDSPQDVLDFRNDLPPSSLRFDAIHLNDAGCRAVARKIQEFITAHGW